MWTKFPLFFVASLMLCAVRAAASEPPTYETDVAPILKTHCVRCHNPASKKAELDLTDRQGLFTGGESGRILELGSAAESLLFEMVHERLMPPDGEETSRLSDAEIETIRRWLDTGAPFADRTNPNELMAANDVNNHQIEPLLRLRCATCHGSRVQQGGLDVRTKSSLLKGGESGPAIVLGDPAASRIIQRIHRGEMPPKKQLVQSGVRPMTGDEIEQLSRWIALGAPEVELQPDVATPAPDPLVSDADRDHWAFQTPAVIATPILHNDSIRTPIDAFIAQRLREHDLPFSPPADRRTLLRRATFDLTGLPPDPAEVAHFIQDDDPLAYENMIDRLLASPRYGERWGQYWLDAAGYADSEGKRSADPIRPYAFRYRDYVIRSLNQDKPYDRFLLEQIAGDELADVARAERITAAMVDNLIATGFLRMAPDGTGSDVVNTASERLEVVADELDVFSSTVLGLTMKCARCHSHKYDPLPQRDYYRLAAVFKGAFDEHDWLKPVSVPGQTKSTAAARYLEIMTPEEKLRLADRRREIGEEIARQQQKLAELVTSLRDEHLAEQLAGLPAAIRDDLRQLLATKATDRSSVQKYLAGKFEATLRLTDKQVKAAEGYRRPALGINRLIAQLEKERSENPKIRALWDRGDPSPTYIYVRGDFRTPGRLVGPGVPSVLTDGKTPFAPVPPWPGASKTGRRLALAKWLIADDHPLTARVMVNRIWRHHFGRGIVTSIDNFGKLGTPPTHPSLLDWLARRFINEGWSIKELHRLIMTSAVYRQSSQIRRIHQQQDPENQWLSRMPLRRADAEEVRDTLLHVAGKLDGRPFGRPDAVDVRSDGLVTSIGQQSSWRRSIFVRHRRKEMPSILETFDLPQMNPACQQRLTSTVAQQSLYLLNNPAVRDLSRHFAERVQRAEESVEGQIEQVFVIALSRPPTAEETDSGRAALSALEKSWQDNLVVEEFGPGDVDPRRAALAVYCHTIMNSAEFIYFD